MVVQHRTRLPTPIFYSALPHFCEDYIGRPPNYPRTHNKERTEPITQERCRAQRQDIQKIGKRLIFIHSYKARPFPLFQYREFIDPEKKDTMVKALGPLNHPSLFISLRHLRQLLHTSFTYFNDVYFDLRRFLLFLRKPIPAQVLIHDQSKSLESVWCTVCGFLVYAKAVKAECGTYLFLCC